MNTAPKIGLVDDEPEILKALRRLLSMEGFQIREYNSANDFIQSDDVQHLDCLVLDVSMPGLDGLELQARLKRAGMKVPIVFLTGTGDIPTSVRAVKAGAVNFLTKPFDADHLLAAIRDGLAEYASLKAEEQELGAKRSRLDRLTPREREVLGHVISGKLNKQIASSLGISEQTVKVHRMRITEKMGVSSVAELVRAAERLGVSPASN
ncbi:response regulator transcription factor [Bremerella sp.]|uniref:response regulator transcription factor n=1 Tax=Bremerella sp. TaxID=2795602 RepID=UPI003919E630